MFKIKNDILKLLLIITKHVSTKLMIITGIKMQNDIFEKTSANGKKNYAK